MCQQMRRALLIVLLAVLALPAGALAQDDDPGADPGPTGTPAPTDTPDPTSDDE